MQTCKHRECSLAAAQITYHCQRNTKHIQLAALQRAKRTLAQTAAARVVIGTVVPGSSRWHGALTPLASAAWRGGETGGRRRRAFGESRALALPLILRHRSPAMRTPEIAIMWTGQSRQAKRQQRMARRIGAPAARGEEGEKYAICRHTLSGRALLALALFIRLPPLPPPLARRWRRLAKQGFAAALRRAFTLSALPQK